MLRQSSMETANSQDCESDEMCGSYNLSADVSESESPGGSFSRRGYDADFASSSVASSPVSYDCLAGNDTFSLPLNTPIVLPVIGGKDVELSEVEMMKERFAKLLLGEDMSGGGKGVCTALAISNAITNLSATVFGELWRLAPLAPQKKSMWCREMEWLLSVSDSIVELVPSIQKLPGRGRYEVMIPQPRSDLHMNLPALKKLDAMLLSILDGFCDTDFGYADAETQDANSSSVSSGRPSVRQEEKWWLPCPIVPLKGLSCDARKRLQQCRDCTNQILKAALAINSNVLAEMEIPAAYLDTLPKTGKACLGDIIYRYITADKFLPECMLEYLDISSEHQTMDIINRIEAALHVWKQKDQKKHKSNSTSSNRSSSWGGKVKGLVSDSEKNNFLAQRAETLLHSLRLRFPALPQTALDMNKIQYNKDVGQSILESYSRVMESLAFNIMARIDDVIYIDDATRKSTNTEAVSLFKRGGLPVQKRISPSPFSIQHSPHGSPFGTPTFCSSPPIMHSPRRTPSQVLPSHCKLSEVQVATDVDKQWSYAGSLGARRVWGDAPERN